MTRPSQEDSQEHMPVGRPSGEFLARVAAGQDAAPFDFRHDETESVQGVGHLLTTITDHGDNRAGILDLAHLVSQRGVNTLKQPARLVGWQSEDEGINIVLLRRGTLVDCYFKTPPIVLKTADRMHA